MRRRTTGAERLALLGVIGLASAFALSLESGLQALSRIAGWLTMLPLVLRATPGFRPPRLPWAAVPLAHLPVAMLFAAGQIVVMLAVRQLAGLEAESLIAAVRYDLAVYAALVVALLFTGRRAQE
jgi:hypothetical protein